MNNNYFGKISGSLSTKKSGSTYLIFSKSEGGTNKVDLIIFSIFGMISLLKVTESTEPTPILCFIKKEAFWPVTY